MVLIRYPYWLQGIRAAVPQDLAAIQGLLLPLEERGVLAPRTDDQLLSDLPYFRVAERDAKVTLNPACRTLVAARHAMMSS